jgi:16S rRNA (guanine527-N7)-methyltransferase
MKILLKQSYTTSRGLRTTDDDGLLKMPQDFRASLKAALSRFDLEALTETQIDQLVKHYSMLRHWNRRINLTRIIEAKEVAMLHYAESLLGARLIGEATSVLDVGSGAGFPAVPLAVARPDVQVTALEANQKKSLFLKEVRDELSLANLTVVRSRLESFDWSSYDLLTSRALDQAEAILPSVIRRLTGRQRLMLYCARGLLTPLERSLDSGFSVKTLDMPQSESRLIATFSRRK